MLGPIDHVGYLARDLDAAVAQVADSFGIPVARHIGRPEFALVGAYLGSGDGNIEVFSFTDPDVLDERLGDSWLALDHVAYSVPDIDAIAAQMRKAGIRFTGPDLRGELLEPVELGGIRHLWTIPETASGQIVQLMQR